MAAKKKRAGVEWVGGFAVMPAYVTGEGEPYRPEMLLWVSSDGLVLGTTTAKPGEAVGAAAEHLRSTIERPMIGRAHAPARVRVASSSLAEALRAVRPAIEIVCAPTPEIDTVFAAMHAMMDAEDDTEHSYLSDDIGPNAIASFFRAAADLFRAKPWKVVPGDQDIFSVTIEKLGLRDAALSVIGQMGESLGFVLFSDIDDFEAYLEAADAMDHGEEPRMPAHFALNFESGAELPTALREEVADHRWEVAAPNAYPWLVAIDEELIARPPTAKELSIAEAIAVALPKVLLEKEALSAAWSGGAPLSRTLVVSTYAGECEIMLRTPHAEARPRSGSPFDVMADLFELANDGDELDNERRRELEDVLVREFVASAEAKVLTDVQSCHFVMDFAADYFGATIATLAPRELEEIVFEIIPRKVSIDASKAGWIIEESRAFYAFLERKYELGQADACLRVLGGDAVKRLERALGDSRNFGMAKSLFAAGREAGFDMDSKEGIEAWMRVAQSKPLPASFGFPAFGASPPKPVDKAAARAARNKRKVARQARKKNR